LEGDLRDKKFSNEVAAHYGLAVALLRAKEPVRAEAELAPLMKTTDHPMFALLAARIKQAKSDNQGAADVLKQALTRYPDNRALNYAYIEALQQLEKTGTRRRCWASNSRISAAMRALYGLQAKGYASLGKRLLQHQAQAEA
jgi:predicted Zn-dependent protease